MPRLAPCPRLPLALLPLALLPLALLPALPAQTAWTKVPLLEARGGHATAYDSVRGRTVLFGGWPNLGDTWEWDGTSWSQRSPAVSPSARDGHAMAYDQGRARVVLFGGLDRQVGRLADTWEWDGTAWLQRTPALSPPASAGHGLAYDAARRRTVLYGGNVPQRSTWEWDGTAWTVVTTTQGPPAARGHQLVYDATQRRVLFVGGNGPYGLVETWEWFGFAWSVVGVSANRPPFRDDHALAYDAVRQRVVLFGGYRWQQGMPQLFGDLWELDYYSGWTQAGPSPAAPSPRSNAALSFDPVRRRVVLSCGGDLQFATSDTWEWDGIAWQLRAGPDAPPPGSGSLAFDARRGRTVLYQGGAPPGVGRHGWPPTTWEFGGSRWRLAASGASGGLFERGSFALAYDPSRGKVVLFGGVVYGKSFPFYLNDTFEWDGSAWTQVATAMPPSRARAAMAFDTHRQRLLLYGGVGGTGPRNDTWEWGAAGWQQRTPAHTPPARDGAGMVFDDARGRMVLFLPDDSNSAAPETWEWDGTDWSQRQPRVQPPPRTGFGLVYDDRRARVVLFGGTHAASSTAFQDTWEWDGTDWRQRTVPAAPAPRSTIMAYDTLRGRTVIFGGVDLRTAFGDTWEYGPVQPAGYQEFGNGCAGSAGVPRLRALELPWLGDRFTLRAERLLPGSSALLWLGASRSTWGGLPLPLDLGAAGMPGCFLHVRPNLALPLFNLGGVADASVAVPGDTVLLGQPLFGQVLAVDRGANAFGATTSNGGEARIGAR